MRAVKNRTKIAFVLLVMLLLAAFPKAWAEEIGSITIRLQWQGAPLPGGSVKLYRVEGWELSPAPPFSPEQARALAAYAQANGIAGREEIPDSGGAVVFTGLKPGAYLLVQEETSEGFLPFEPFLVLLPCPVEDSLLYDVDASPKCAPRPMEPGTPPGLPQTGQINWPVPVLGGAGLMLLAAGVVMCFGGRRRGDGT